MGDNITILTVVVAFIGVLATMAASLVAIMKWMQGKIDKLTDRLDTAEAKHRTCEQENATFRRRIHDLEIELQNLRDELHQQYDKKKSKRGGRETQIRDTEEVDS